MSQYENGAIERPRQSAIDGLARVFDCDAAWFEHGRGRGPDWRNAPVLIYEVAVPRWLTPGSVDRRRLPLAHGYPCEVPQRWLGKTKLAPDRVVLIRAPNDVAWIEQGDVVFIDKGRRHGDGVFLCLEAAGGVSLREGPGDGGALIVGRAILVGHKLAGPVEEASG